MADELYPGYDPLVDPNPITCWGFPSAQELEAGAQRQRERVALWVWDEIEQTKELRNNPCG